MLSEAARNPHYAGSVCDLPTACAYVAIEVKRRAGIDAVEQLTRYLTWLRQDPYLTGGVRGVLVALHVAPQARAEAESRGISVVTVDYDELRGLASTELTLF